MDYTLTMTKFGPRASWTDEAVPPPEQVAQWWHDDFSSDERALIEREFQPLVPINIASMFLDAKKIATLATYLRKSDHRHLGYRLLDHAEAKLAAQPHDVSARHFYFAIRGRFFYRWRNSDEFALGAAIDAFLRQIEIASEARPYFASGRSHSIMPEHSGYKQMRIIEESRGNLAAARELCVRAKSEGWADDWDRHIVRLDKKLSQIKK